MLDSLAMSCDSAGIDTAAAEAGECAREANIKASAIEAMLSGVW